MYFIHCVFHVTYTLSAGKSAQIHNYLAIQAVNSVTELSGPTLDRSIKTSRHFYLKHCFRLLTPCYTSYILLASGMSARRCSILEVVNNETALSVLSFGQQITTPRNFYLRDCRGSIPLLLTHTRLSC